MIVLASAADREASARASSSVVSSSGWSGPSSRTSAEPHAIGRVGLVGAVSAEQENWPFVEIVGEEDDEIQRRAVGPVQILEYEHHRYGARAVRDEGERVLEDPEL